MLPIPSEALTCGCRLVYVKYFSLFSGIGGFESGFPKSWECVGFSEVDRYAIQIYKNHFRHKNYGDITKINIAKLPNFHLLCGGFPCQAFSIAGNRRGFEDMRGTLIFEVCRLAKAKQPRLILLENVKGLLSHDSGSTFYTIIRSLDELGYDLQWQVLNSKNFGVPQNRERVFIVGHLRGTRRPEVFPFTGSNAKDIEQLNKPGHSNDRVFGANGISPTLTTMQGGGKQPFVLNQQTRNSDRPSLRYSSGGSGLLVKKDQAFCLPTSGGSGQYLLGAKIRRLTPVECERLQGFPDHWTAYGVDDISATRGRTVQISDTQRYKCLGNAVTVNVIREIARRLR
jgi:DNA (cytosine-5)-methyltransferase 1